MIVNHILIPKSIELTFNEQFPVIRSWASSLRKTSVINETRTLELYMSLFAYQALSLDNILSGLFLVLPCNFNPDGSETV
jgi:hypothetical protein